MSSRSKRRRRGHFKPSPKPRRAETPPAEDREKIEEAALATERRLTGKKKAAVNPYVWDGDRLIHAQKGYVVAHFNEFPQLLAARKLRETTS